MKVILIAFVFSALLTIVVGYFCIPLLKRLKAGQTVLKYVEQHKGKNGTPTMAGLFFIVCACVIFFAFGGYKGRMAVVSTSIGLGFMIVGFIDDFIKIRFHRNEGLSPLQKISFQGSIAMLAGVFAFLNGLTEFYVPFIKTTVDLGWGSIVLIVVIFIATTNSVNLTDGLDGLAGSTSLVYLLFTAILIYIQQTSLNKILLSDEDTNSLILLIFCLIGAVSGFLTFNVNKARVFMGDTGSLALGGFIASISIFSANSLFIPFLGIMFVLSTVSVILQVLRYKKSKKRFFLMAPIHHHFQMKGMTETQISYMYSLITCIMGALIVIFYI